MPSTVPGAAPEPSKRPFWPKRSEAAALAWGLLLFLAFPLVLFAPFVLLLPVRRLPEGDSWGLVAVRVGVVIAFLAAYRAWIDLVVVVVRRVFTGRIGPEFDAWLAHEEPPPVGAWQGLRANAHLAFFAVLGLAVFLGYLRPDSILLSAHQTPRRFRNVMAMAQWCQGHQNTVHATALVVGVGSLWLHAQRVWTAARRVRAAG